MIKIMKILILKKYDKEVTAIIKECFPADWEINISDPEDAQELIKEADILIPSHAVVDNELLDNALKLKVIQTGAGYDNIDIKCCREKGIRVCNAPSVNTAEVAEHAIAFIFNWFKKIDKLDNDIRVNGWSSKKDGKAFSDLSIGIIGYGSIGKKVSEIAKVFGMKIFIYSEHNISRSVDGICFTETLNELLCASDIVTLHTSASKEKTNMISDKAFSLMKNNALFVNTSRGSLVDEKALCRALENKEIGGAALDVFKKEPLPLNSCLRKFDNVIMTPHNAGEPDLNNSYKKRFSFFADNIKAVLDNRTPDGIIV